MIYLSYACIWLSGFMFLISFFGESGEVNRELLKISALWMIAGALVA